MPEWGAGNPLHDGSPLIMTVVQYIHIVKCDYISYYISFGM